MVTDLFLMRVFVKQSHREGISERGFWKQVDPSGEPPATAGLTSKK